jgi:hypothetical protein
MMREAEVQIGNSRVIRFKSRRKVVSLAQSNRDNSTSGVSTAPLHVGPREFCLKDFCSKDDLFHPPFAHMYLYRDLRTSQAALVASPI